jgi:diguanylate cyclase (GGDEF)-like protein
VAVRFLKNKKILRPIQGFILAIGAPAGWLIIQELAGINPLDDVSTHPGIYLYLGVGTALAFLIFGFYVGSYEKKIEEQALVDPLTGLGNRNKFYLIAGYELERSHRYNDKLSLAILDIDFFKKINDDYGHSIGDSVLKGVADTIRATVRKADISVRWGGEEFLFLMPGTTLTESNEISERVRHNIATGTFHRGIKVTVSIGITEYIDGDTLEFMIKRADKALYEAKNSGRNRVSIG